MIGLHSAGGACTQPEGAQGLRPLLGRGSGRPYSVFPAGCTVTACWAERCRMVWALAQADGNWAVCNIFCIAVFVLALVLGLGLGGSFRQYGELLKDSGFGADYGAKYGTGTAILNFAIYGLFIVLYYNLIGANWNARDARLRILHGLLLLQGKPSGKRLADHGWATSRRAFAHKGALRGCSERNSQLRHQRAGHRHRPLLCKRSVARLQADTAGWPAWCCAMLHYGTGHKRSAACTAASCCITAALRRAVRAAACSFLCWRPFSTQNRNAGS